MSEIRELMAILAIKAHIPFSEARTMTLADTQAVLDVLADINNQQ